MEHSTMTLTDYLAIVKRRKWSFILPATIVFITAAVVALSLPSVYKSTSTILIEEQDIPADYVKTSVTSYAEQRLQTIHQRITSFSRLLDMINRFNPYPDLKEKRTNEEIVAKMRDDIILEPISADVVDRRTGRPSEATIAFTLSYEGKDPRIVQRISNTLATIFLEENLQVREKQATETSEFLEQEMDKVKAKLTELEAKMAAFKEAHVNELPDLLQVNMQSLNNIESNIQRLSEQLRSTKEREGYLMIQLAGVPRTEEKRDKTRLDELKVQLVHLQTRFSGQYPDVIKTRAEIAELEKRLKTTRAVIKNQENDQSDNPAYITLASQLSSTQADIASIKRQILEAEKTVGVYRQRIANTPKVEEAYKAILIERDNTQAKYNDLMRKHMEAMVAQGLEKGQKGERFTLIDPARLPETPDKPNRLAIMLIGMVLGIGAGVGWASLREFTDLSIRDSESLVLATSFPVLGSIPDIKTEEDLQKEKKKRITIIIGMALCIVAGLIVFHFLVMDLNVFWAKLMRKFTF
jgi:polysaccharide chain length determinant protein (PEP-CTERM system associated)